MTIAQERHPVVTDKAPRPLQGAPYSQAIATRGLVFCSGQVPLDPVSGELVEGGIAEQARQVMENLKAVVEAAGATMQDIAKTTIFMTDLGDYGTINEVYGSYFEGAPPARSAVQVSALPAGASVEIEAIVAGE